MDWAGRLEVDSRNVFISLGELVFFVTREKGRETTTKEM